MHQYRTVCCIFNFQFFIFNSMSRVCVKTGKKTGFGNTRSHSMRHTRRNWKANIQKKRVFDPKTGTYVRMKVSTSYLRTLAKRLQAGKSI